MKLNTVVLLVVLIALTLFAAFNFHVLLAPQAVWLFGWTVSLPLGMVLVVLTAVIATFFTLLTSLSNLRAQAESARLLRELQTLRSSLDAQEASRFAQLQAYLSERFEAQERTQNQFGADLAALEDYVRARLGQDSRRP